MDSNLRIYIFLTMFSLKVATACLDVSLISISLNSSSSFLSAAFVCSKIPHSDRIDNFHYFGRTQQERFVIYKRGLILQGKHVSKFIQQRKPDEGLQHSIGGSSEIEIKCFQCRALFWLRKLNSLMEITRV